ncbi:hypothetical protein [Mucilaginibacter sp. BT774]|uniref:hypothetical protein n=1 Tax=Mucilaginibacter sp. BT774 TaxID=3062276 RepID=UPI0026773DFC|nr:hypothetical protein [Mucilaginibacter sp. BT774]
MTRFTYAQAPEKLIISDFLKAVYGHMRVNAIQYDGTKELNEFEFRKNMLKTDSAQWLLNLTARQSANHETLDMTADVILKEGHASSTALAVSFDFSSWSRKNYVLVPASMYNGNRYPAIGNEYNPPYTKDMYYNPKVPLTISNNPRLSAELNKASLVELQTGNAATPAMCFFSPGAKKGFILLTTQQTKFGNSGLTIAENAKQDSCSFRISAPAVRKLAAGFGDFHESGDKGYDWKPGDRVAINMRLYVFDANSIPDLLTRFMQVRKEVTGPNRPRNIMPMSKELAVETAICSNNFIHAPAGSYYKPENNDDFQLGWVSGMMNTYPMLALNNAKERERVAEEIDFVVNKLQGKSGFFYGGIEANGNLRFEKMHADFPQGQAMVRKNSDALLWLMKHLMLLKAQGYGNIIKPEWELAAEKLADAFAITWKKYGEFGQYIAPETGQIAVFNSTAGAVAPGGLAIAASYFNRPEWLRTAREAADYYYERDVVKQGLTGGDCGDISMDANSESAFGFLESLMALYNVTGDRAWLQKAQEEAALCSTWVLSYDPVFPATSQIAKLQSHMAGAVWASIQNKHAAPGICDASGDYLFKLYRATGNKLYANLIRDIQHAHAEAVNMPGHFTTNNLIGSSMERIQPSDAEGKGSIGNFINTRNSWTETNGMLMAIELPGIYLQTNKNEIYVFDHVEAKIVKHVKDGVVLSITNPTKYDAEVSILAETLAQTNKPLGYTSFLKWPKVDIKAGKSALFHISSDGKTIKGLSK